MWDLVDIAIICKKGIICTSGSPIPEIAWRTVVQIKTEGAKQCEQISCSAIKLQDMKDISCSHQSFKIVWSFALIILISRIRIWGYDMSWSDRYRYLRSRGSDLGGREYHSMILEKLTIMTTGDRVNRPNVLPIMIQKLFSHPSFANFYFRE